MGLPNMNKKRVFLVITGILLSMFISALDSTVVGIAMPKIVSDLKGLNLYMWSFTAYLLASTIVVPIAGKISDIYGRKPVYFVGMAAFLIASGFCGLSGSMMQLIIFRGIQGVGGGIIATICSIIIGDIFAPAERVKYQGLTMGAAALASVIGPFLGGIITDNLSWRWIFYINLPIGIIAIVLLYISLPSLKVETAKPVIDFAGMIAFILAVTPMLLGFSWAGVKYDWNSIQIIGLFSFSIIMLLLFIFIEMKVEEPLMTIVLFKNFVFSNTLIMIFLVTAVMYGTILYLPMFVQDVIGSSATNSGAVTVPMMIAMFATSIIGGQIAARIEKSYKVLTIIGLLAATIGMVLLSKLNIKSTDLNVIIGMVFLGAGIGLSMPLTTAVVQSIFPRDKLSFATSVATLLKNIGGAVGTAVLGSVMISSMNKNLNNIDMSILPSKMRGMVKDAQSLTNPDVVNNIRKNIPSDIFIKLMIQIKTAISSAVHNVFITSVFILAAALIASLFWKVIPLRKKLSDEENTII